MVIDHGKRVECAVKACLCEHALEAIGVFEELISMMCEVEFIDTV